MFYTIEELVQQADRDYQGNIAKAHDCLETGANWTGTS